MTSSAEPEQRGDGRWIAAVPGFPGILALGDSPEDALANAQVLAHRAWAELLDDGEPLR